MAVCAVFCWKQSEKADREAIRNGLIYLIEEKDVDLFYLRGENRFERIVLQELAILQRQYTFIGYAVVLHKAPSPTLGHSDYSNTVCLPCYAFPSYAKRNLEYWLIKRSDFVLTFMPNLIGSAEYFKKFLRKKGKVLVNLADSSLKPNLNKFN